MNDRVALGDTLRTLQRLTDAEQYLLGGWFATGARRYLYRLGIDDSLIGREPLFEDDEGSAYDEARAVPSRDVLQVIAEIRDLAPEHRLALKYWFYWHDRSLLARLGLTDAEIGVPRVVPDDIWSYEAGYEKANDGTLRFVNGDRASVVNVRVRLDGTWQDP